jgi:hypothetical protein
MGPEAAPLCREKKALKYIHTGEPDDSDEHSMDAFSPQDAIIFAFEVEYSHSNSK